MKKHKVIPKESDSDEKEPSIPILPVSSSLSQNGIFRDRERCAMVQNVHIEIDKGNSDCMPGCFDFLKSIFRR